ncbi:hypothetical protein HY041_03515 [Candidatus Roizmanbacteria bacterium]|nr:hypothetical protein [Candidatus Roizmanbacteria bacterium]
MKHISIRQGFLFLLFAVFFFYSPTLVKGQVTNEDATKKYGISYPITSLGNCADYTTCRNYCEDETHHEVCIQYAKQKGFYEERKTDEILTHAKTELGCNSETECKNICEKEENFEKCTSFAKKTGLVKEQISSPKNQEILTKAKEILGCDSPQTCKSICEQEGNRQRCSEFAKQTGLKGGEERRGPGGCNSEESCRSFCSNPDNFNECSKFKPPEGQDRRGGPSQEGFKGPGGCNSESSCREYCEKNPSECQKFGQGPEGKGGERGGSPEGMKREEIEKLCKDNPDKCRGQGSSPEFHGGSRSSPQERRNQEARPPENSQEHSSEQRREPPQNQKPPNEQHQESSNQNRSPEEQKPPEVKGVGVVRNILETILYSLFER